MPPPGVPDRLFALPRFGAGPGLRRMEALRAALPPLPHPPPDTLKIAGSNGKGTVAAMTAAVLEALGLPCGLYISPHLESLRERISVAGEAVSDGELAEAGGWALEAAASHLETHPGDDFAAFEVLTAAALYHFRRRGPAVAVAEAGIGGRLDSTRVFPGRFAALTSLDLEHTALLGASRAEIACEKAGLCPDGGVVVAGPLEEELLDRLEEELHRRRVRLLRAGRNSGVTDVEVRPDGMRFDLAMAGGPDVEKLEVPLAGPHQAANAALAALLVREWAAVHRPEISAARLAEGLRRGLAALRWPGRFERLAPRRPGEPEVYTDVGHTPAAVAALAETVRAALAGRPLVLLAGVSEGRAPGELLAPLLPLAAAAVCARPRHRGASAEKTAAALRRARPGLPVSFEPGEGERVERALQRTLAVAGELGPEGVVLAAGGFFLAAEVRVAHRGGDPAGLRFF